MAGRSCVRVVGPSNHVRGLGCGAVCVWLSAAVCVWQAVAVCVWQAGAACVLLLGAVCV